MAGPAKPRSMLHSIAPLIGKRIGSALLTLLLVSIVIFTISGLLPGDAAQERLGQSATADAHCGRSQAGL